MLKGSMTAKMASRVSYLVYNINWDQFKILSSGNTDYHCKVKETLFIQEAAFNVNISSEKLMLY